MAAAALNRGYCEGRAGGAGWGRLGDKMDGPIDKGVGAVSWRVCSARNSPINRVTPRYVPS
jgi:hypothetical protein